MIWRISTTTAFGLVFGAWAFLDIRLYEEQGSLYTTLQEPVVVIGLMALAILTGMATGRGWVLLSLAGPIAALAYLQEAGYRGPDGISALSSPPSIVMLIWFGLLLLIGVAISLVWHHVNDQQGTTPP